MIKPAVLGVILPAVNVPNARNDGLGMDEGKA